MRIHALINYSVADLGTIKLWAKNKGHIISQTEVYHDVSFPNLEEFDMLIVLGGVMGAYDEEKYPWLRLEKQFIHEAIQANKFVLGICLGAQMIAEVLGGRAYPHEHKEIGWWEVEFGEVATNISLFRDIPKRLTVFQYHGDTFDLPKDTVWLAKSEASKNQVFIYKDRVVGLQFHPEFNEEKLKEIVTIHGKEIIEEKYAQIPDDFLNRQSYHQEAKKFLFTLLDNMKKEFMS